MKDPAFLFYDGDAARDVSHMNRLERGCYFDIIQAQRKFGRLSEELIKKILGKDFDSCWESIKICLSYDNHMFFIEWLENSTIKRKEYSESRRKNRVKTQTIENQQNKANPQKTYDNHMLTYDKHMENENENENENKDDIKEGGVGETKNWRNDFETYQQECHEAFSSFLTDPVKIEKQKELNPGVDVALSIRKGYENFWKTQAGWQHKKKKRIKEIDWDATIINSIDINKVYLQRNVTSNDTKTRFDTIAERTAKAVQLMGEPNS